MLLFCCASSLLAQKTIQDQREYELFTSAVAEQDADRKLQLVRTWSTEYPNSAFRDERLMLLVAACRDTQRIDEAAAAVTELYQRDPGNSSSSLLVATVLTKLANPTAQQVGMGREAAARLRASARQLSRPSAGSTDGQPEAFPSDPDLQRLIALLREWRREGAARQERQAQAREQQLIRLADATAEWADRNR